MKNDCFLRYIGVVFGVCMVVAGCSSTPPTKFYRMNSLEGPGSQARSVSVHDSLMIGVGPVEIAAYIDRPQIVTRIGENELNVAEFNRWASPIRGEVTRVLAENLAVLLSTDSVLTYPWRQSADVKFQVMVDIEHFDGKSGDGVFLQAQWGVFGADGEVLLVRKSTYTEQVNSKDYSSYVDALSLSLDGLSRDIAAAIEDLSKQASYK